MDTWGVYSRGVAYGYYLVLCVSVEDSMTASEEAAQKINEEHRLLLAANASHNYRAALAESQMREKCWRVGCIVFAICFAAMVAVCVGRM